MDVSEAIEIQSHLEEAAKNGVLSHLDLGEADVVQAFSALEDEAYARGVAWSR